MYSFSLFKLNVKEFGIVFGYRYFEVCSVEYEIIGFLLIKLASNRLCDIYKVVKAVDKITKLLFKASDLGGIGKL